MPHRAPKPCSKAGCGKLGDGRYCPDHAYLTEQYEQQRKAALDKQRGNASQRGYGARWRSYRLVFLRSHPLCAECERQGRVTLATEVDHIKPHRGDMKLFWLHSNHQGLCKPCHSRKTATEDSTFASPASPTATRG